MRQRRAAGFIILTYRAGCGATTFLEVRIHFNHAQLGLAGEQLHSTPRPAQPSTGPYSIKNAWKYIDPESPGFMSQQACIKSSTFD